MKFCGSKSLVIVCLYKNFSDFLYIICMKEKRRRNGAKRSRSKRLWPGHPVGNSRECVLLIGTVQLSAKLKAKSSRSSYVKFYILLGIK